MNRGLMMSSAVVLGAAVCAVAQPYSQLKFDIDNMEMKFYSGFNGSGSSLASVTAGGGANFTGSWQFVLGPGAYVNNQIEGNNLSGGSGPFFPAGGATLVGASGFLNFQNGSLVNGTFSFDAPDASSGLDTVSGTLGNSGTSSLFPLGNAWFVDGLVLTGGFVDQGDGKYAQVDVSLFNNVSFFGSFAALFVSDDGTSADYDMVVEIPAPGAALALAAAGLVTIRRRR